MRKPLLRYLTLLLSLSSSLYILSHLFPNSLQWDFDLPAPGPESEPEIPPDLDPHPETNIWHTRKLQVRDAYLHALNAYKTHAFPYDEILAVSGNRTNNLNGWAVTLLDSLDTMYLMGLHSEFEEAIPIVASQRFHMISPNHHAHFFETVIRYLGGLLSAYALSHEPIFLSRADELGRLLLPAFNTPSGLPLFSVNTDTGRTTSPAWRGYTVLFAEAASCQMEYKYLAKMTGKKEYYEKVERIMSVMYNASDSSSDPSSSGLFADTWTYDGEPAANHFGVGATFDSGYEYLLKQYLLTGDERARKQYLTSIQSILSTLLYISPTRHLLYATSTHSSNPTHIFEHLSCFLPGLLALGAHLLPDSPDFPRETREMHKWAAHGLAYTCWVTYADQETGLGPDQVRFVREKWDDVADGDDDDERPIASVSARRWVDVVKEWEEAGREGGEFPPGYGGEYKEVEKAERDYGNDIKSYLLRPEVIESIYLMWKTTKNEIWRERGYGIFKALEEHTKTDFGYASIKNVDKAPYEKLDDMPSYFLAETLKYLYLLFDDDDPVELDKWVFNTEAHPLPVFEWSEWERERYNISKKAAEEAAEVMPDDEPLDDLDGKLPVPPI